LVQFYYRTSPPLAGMIAASETSRLVARWFLTPVVGVAYLAVRFGITTMLLVPAIGFLLPVAIIWLSGRGCRHDRRRSAAGELFISAYEIILSYHLQTGP